MDEILDADDDLLTTPQDDIFKMVHAKPSIAKTDKVSERPLMPDLYLMKCHKRVILKSYAPVDEF